MTTRSKRAVVVFAKAAIPGTVKTRLSPPLSSEEAAALHSSFVMDTLERTHLAVGRSGIDCFLACAPSKDHPFFTALKSRFRMTLLQQEGNDLGERMEYAFQDLFDQSYTAVVIVGCDVPTLSSKAIANAFSLLETYDLVLGPCPDGGYYLIGMRGPLPGIFRGIPWGTSAVFELTEKRAVDAGASIGFTAVYHDIDTPHDLRALIGERSHANTLTPRTARLIQKLSHRLKADFD